MMWDDLRTKLLSHSGLLARINTRLYPVKFPQSPTYPLVVATQISGPRPGDADGATGNQNARWQFSIWGKTYKETKETAEQFRLSVNQLPGDVGSSVIYMADLVSEMDLWDPATSLYHVPIDVMLWHSEGV